MRFNIFLIMHVLIVFFYLTILALPALATDYYVSPDGTASWPNCTSEGNPCEASNTSQDFLSAQAGDTVYFLDGDYIAINWNELDYPEKGIQEQAEEEDFDFNPDYVEEQFEYFTEKMKEGDIVLAYGDTKILGIGKIKGEYYKEDSAEIFQHRRRVEWLDIPEFKAEKLGEDFYSRVSWNRTILPIDEKEFIEKINEKIHLTQDVKFYSESTHNLLMSLLTLKEIQTAKVRQRGIEDAELERHKK